MTPTVADIPLEAIDIGPRVRPLRPRVAGQLAADIARPGLQSPIQVTPGSAGRYRLVAGRHRLEAVRILARAEGGPDTIAATVVSGTELQLAEAELLENLMQQGMTALDRAVHCARFKTVYLALHEGARHGGDRKSADSATENQVATLATWYGAIATVSEVGERTAQRVAAIGAALSEATIAALRGTDHEDHQASLEALARYTPEVQARIIDQLCYAAPTWQWR